MDFTPRGKLKHESKHLPYAVSADLGSVVNE